MTAITSLTYDPILDLAPYVGQRQATFRFSLSDVRTGEILRDLNPYRTGAVLTHDTSRLIKRQITNIAFNREDTALLNTVSNRVKIQMLFPQRDPYDLGTYLFTDQLRTRTTAGLESSTTLLDSMFIVDQQLPQSYTAGTYTDTGEIIAFRPVDQAIGDVLQGVPVSFTAESSPFYSIGVWPAGITRGTVVNDLAIDGDYFAPWFDNTNTLRFIRSFDPSARIPDFDYDANHVITRDSIVFADDLLNAPNQFIVISNGTVSGNSSVPIVGAYSVPASAPHSEFNRGFLIPDVSDRQVDTLQQANAIAFNLGQRQTIFETVQFNTAPDPRHDGYNVFRLGGENWLEIAWSLPLRDGSEMSHVGRKAYS